MATRVRNREEYSRGEANKASCQQVAIGSARGWKMSRGRCCSVRFVRLETTDSATWLGCQGPHSNTQVPSSDCPVFSLLSGTSHRPLVLSGANVGDLNCTSFATAANQFGLDQMSIDILPDEPLLEIFSFYLIEKSKNVEPWIPLVHVCRRWRSLVFASPRRLNVRVYYTPKRPIKVLLDIWPNLPIQISAHGYQESRWLGENTLVDALEHNDRICQIQLDGTRSQLERILPAVQKPFPALNRLSIGCSSEDYRQTIAPLPQALLGGSAQHLRSCCLWAVDFPGIWELLLTAHHLVTLSLLDIPYSMSTSPEAMATCLSTMPNLESLSVILLPPQSLLHRSADQPNRHLSPPTRVVLPSLTNFRFQAMVEYIEDVVSRIDVPSLEKVDITFFDQPVFNIPQLRDFLGRIENFKAYSRGSVAVQSSCIKFALELGPFSFELAILCHGSGRQIWSMAQLCGSFLHHPSALKRLDIRKAELGPFLRWQDELEWLDLLRPFTGLEDLRIGRGLLQYYAPALRLLAGERVTEALPALQNLFIEELESSKQIHKKGLGKFVTARKRSGLPVTIHSWEDPRKYVIRLVESDTDVDWDEVSPLSIYGTTL